MSGDDDDKQQRINNAELARASAAIEGIREPELVKELIPKYISGEMTIEEVINEARDRFNLKP